jgi:hypothetical protein
MGISIRIRSLAGGLALAALWGVMITQVAAQAPGAGISNTKHDFSVQNGGANSVAVGACTFCHTPHRAIQTRLLWNHTLSSNTFSWAAGATTTGGTTLPTITTSWEGPSKFCLSCHDGSVAIGDVAWFRMATRTGASAINATNHNGDPYQIASVTGSLAGNHPVAHPFPFNGSGSTYNGVTTGVPALASGWQADPTTSGIRLFVQTGTNVAAGTQVGATGIECSSCHDPHNGSSVVDGFFLRGRLDGSASTGANAYICLKCHSK